MRRIDDLIAESEAELRKAASAETQPARDRHIMRSERLLDEAWRLNEADDALPALASGLWRGERETSRKAA